MKSGVDIRGNCGERNAVYRRVGIVVRVERFKGEDLLPGSATANIAMAMASEPPLVTCICSVLRNGKPRP